MSGEKIKTTDFKKTFGESAISFRDMKSGNLGNSFISSGSRVLNLIMTGHPEIGCLERRVYEYFGPESSGKSTMAEESIADCQKKGGKALYIDAEHALDPNYMTNLGINIKKLDIGEPDCGEEAFEMIEWAIDNSFDLVVVDSVAALSPKSEVMGDMGDANMGAAGRMMGQGLRKITNKMIKGTTTSVIFINQLRAKLGVMFGSPETTPGGNALKFFATIRVDMRTPRKDKVVEGSEEVGKKITAKTVKNKVFPPFKECKIHLVYGQGVDKIMDFAECLKMLNLADVNKKQIKFIGRGSDLFYKNKTLTIEKFSSLLKGDKKFRADAKELLLIGAGVKE